MAEKVVVGGREYASSEAYFYPTEPALLVASAAAPNPLGVVRFDTDSDFELQAIGALADIAAAAQTDSTRVIPLVTVLFRLSGGNDWMPNPIPLSLLTGDGRLPFILPETIIIPANSTLSAQLARFAAAVDYNIRLAFLGRKLYLG